MPDARKITMALSVKWYGRYGLVLCPALQKLEISFGVRK